MVNNFTYSPSFSSLVAVHKFFYALDLSGILTSPMNFAREITNTFKTFWDEIFSLENVTKKILYKLFGVEINTDEYKANYCTHVYPTKKYI